MPSMLNLPFQAHVDTMTGEHRASHLGPTFAGPRWAIYSHSWPVTTQQHQASSSTSLSQRFRRAVLKNDLLLAKRIASKAIALSTSTALEAEQQQQHWLDRQFDLETRRPSTHTVRALPSSASGTISPSGKESQPPRRSPLKLPVLTLQEAKQADVPVRERALLRHKALAQQPFDIKNIDHTAAAGSFDAKCSLALAIESGADIELIQWLLDMGHEAEELSRDADNNSIVTIAALHNRPDVIELYISHPTISGIDLLDWSNTSLGQTALHLASIKGHEEVIRLLLHLGAEVDMPDREGNAALHFASAWGHLTVVQLLIERGCAFAVKNTAGFTPADFAYSHSVKAALEAFGRVQHELRRRRWRAASSNHSGASTEDLGLAQLRTHTQGQGSNTSPRMFDDSVLYEDDLEEMGSFSHGGSLSRKSSNSDAAMPPKVERLLGTALPNAAHQTPASQAGSGGGGGSSSTFSGNSPFFQPQWQPSTSSPRGFAARSGSISDTGSVPPLPLGIARPQLNPYPLTPNTRQADPSTPMKHSGPLPQPVREDSIGSSPGMVPSASSASVSSNMGCIANKMILQDQAAMSSYLSRAKASSGGSRRN